VDGFWHDVSWVLPLRSDAATAVANVFNYLGYAPFFIIALPIAYWLWGKQVGTRLTMIVILTAVTNGFLKDLFDDPRPAAEFAIDHRVSDSYGLPSGHAQVATAMWFWIAYEIRRAWAWPVAAFIALGVGLSRVYTGVHDLEDITAGYVLGLATIAVFALLISDRFAWWRALPAAVQIGVLLAIQAPLWFLWPEPGGPGSTFAIGGMLAGWWCGVLLDRRAIQFRRHPNWFIAVGAAAAGLAFAFFVLTKIGAGLTAMGLPPIAGGWLQYFAIAFFVTAVAPFLFIKAGAAVREPRPG
jgi:glycerophosphoryl diester phosphodiesterase